MASPVKARSRVARFFFAHLGTLISIVAFIMIAGADQMSAAGVSRGCWAAFTLASAYLVLAWGMGEHKQFDVVVWALFGVGVLAVTAGIRPLVDAYRFYFGALLFSSFAVAAVVPLVLGREPFTHWHAVRGTPAWQHATPAFTTSNRVLTGFWAILFTVAALSCVSHPADPTYTFVYPNLLVVVGATAPYWLLPLWFKLSPPPLPDRAEPLIMGMPFMFDPKAAAGARALIQFRVSGEEPGDYYIAVQDGRCESFEGRADRADVTVHTPDHVWVDIASGRLDGTQAIADGRYTVEGDYLVLAKLQQWFPVKAPGA
jgi:hypothetical protein